MSKCEFYRCSEHGVREERPNNCLKYDDINNCHHIKDKKIKEMQQVIDKLNECRLLYVPEVKDMEIYACQLGEDELVKKYTKQEGEK